MLVTYVQDHEARAVVVGDNQVQLLLHTGILDTATLNTSNAMSRDILR